MIIYLETKEEFLRHVLQNRIDIEIKERFLQILGHGVAAAEMGAWRNSLMQIGIILLANEQQIPKELGVAIEYKIHNTSKRIDLIFSGKSADEKPAAVIIELKQWEKIETTVMDGLVRTAVGRKVREMTHPSYQAWSYKCLLEDFNAAVQDEQIRIEPCAYLHNCTDPSAIRDSRYDYYLKKAPVFLQLESQDMASFLMRCLHKGDRGETIRLIHDGKVRPSRQMAENFEQMVLGHSAFKLIDEQKVVYERTLRLARGLRPDRRTVVIVRGGPGTGKSVVAIHLMAALLQKELNVRYVSKNAAPRTVYKAMLTGGLTKNRFDNLFVGSGAFVNSQTSEYDVLVVDEAHRLNQFSGLYGNLGENQVQEIIQASGLSVFFLDEDQQVAWKDIGSEQEIRRCAAELGAKVVVDDLPSQFRCAGSDGYLAWLDDVLGIRETANQVLDRGSFDVQLFDDPVSLHAAIRKANDRNRARLVAGYCWRWISKRNAGLYDIILPDYGYAARWNLASEGNTWIISPTGVEEVGCVHTCQGLEVDTIGVIIGPDLVMHGGRPRGNPQARASSDKSLSGWKKAAVVAPIATQARVDRLIRNTYRTLMSRGMKHCWIYACDPGVEEYLRQRIN